MILVLFGLAHGVILAQTAGNAPGTSSQAGGFREVQEVWLTFGLDRIAPLRYAPVGGIPLWQYASSLLYVVIALYLSRFLDAVVTKRLRLWASRTTTKLDDILIDLLHGPLRLISFVILLHLGMQVYTWPGVLEEFFSKGLKIVVAFSITYVLLRGVDVMLRVWRDRTTTPENEQFSKQLLPLLGKLIKVFVVIVAALVTSQNLGLNVTGLIASLSIGGLAVGLAAQDTLANLFGAVAVLVDRPFKVGDRIQLDSVDGTVESIGFRSTRVRNLDGYLVTIPNKTMGNAIITNVAERPTIRTVMNLGVTYDTPADKVKRAVALLEEIFRAHPKTHDVSISFNKFADSSLNLTITHFWKGTDPKIQAADLQDINLAIKTRFDAEGIGFAFPSQTLYLRQDSDWKPTRPNGAHPS